MSFIYAAVPVGAVLMAFYLVLDCILLWQDKQPEEMRNQGDDVEPDAI
jgi:TRAP-type C4-dicarboxylate transport system permease small subunit